MSRCVGIALLGAGWAGQAHARQYSLLTTGPPANGEPGRVVVVADADFERAGALARALGADAQPDWQLAIDRPDVDIVDICLPDRLHPRAAIAAAQAGKHVLCEKPLAPTLQEARAMVDAVVSADVVNMVGFQYRYLPCIQLARSLIDAGALGRIHGVRINFERDAGLTAVVRGGWRSTMNPLGSLAAMGGHALDLAGFLAGPIDELAACLQLGHRERKDQPDSLAPGPVDSADLLVRFTNGATGLLHISWITIGRKHDLEIELAGDSGTLRLRTSALNRVQIATSADFDQGFRTIYAPPPAGGATAHGSAIGFDTALAGQLARFLGAVALSEPATPSFADGLNVEAAIAAARTAATTSAWIRPTPR